MRFLRHGVPVYGVIIGNAVEPDERYILTDSIDYPLVEKTCDLELTGQHFDLPLKKV